MRQSHDLGTNRPASFHWVHVIALAFLCMPSCVKKSKTSNVQSSTSGIQLTGNLVASGGAAKSAKVFLPGTADPVATSDDKGAFSLSITDAQINAIRQLHPNNAAQPFLNDFQIYFETGSGANLLNGRSTFINFTDSGAKDLGSVTLDKPATVAGAVKLIGPTGDGQPTANITIAFDRGETKSDKNGGFALTGVPAGLTRLYIYNDSTAVSTVEVTATSGATLTLDFPLQAYAKNAVNGILFAIPQVGPVNALLPGLPNQVSFRVVRTGNAAYIRYSDDKTKVGGAPWQDIPDQLSFNFPQNGANVLYYQFADGAKGTVSDVLSSAVAANPFADSTGIVIEDGTGVVGSRRVTVHIDVPAAAMAMRLSENSADLGTASTLPFVNASSTYTYTFSIQTSTDGIINDQEQTALRTLYCQFKSADGTVSPTYPAAVKLQPFSPNLTDKTAFTIGDGSGVIAGWQVAVKVNLPINAYEMRMWEEDKVTLSISGDAIIKVGEREQLQNTFFNATSGVLFLYQSSGFKTMYLQFRTEDGLTSTIYTQTFLLTTVQHIPLGFTINDGATVSTSRELTLNMIFPSNAAAYKVSEDPVGISSAVLTYLPPSKTLSFVTAGIGLRTIYIQYLDGAANPGALYSQSILIDPFNNDAGAAWFIDSLGTPWPMSNVPYMTNIPNITLGIRPPAAAVPDGQMEIIRANMSLQGTPVCAPLSIVSSFVPISDHFDFLLTATGPSALCVRFKNLEGDTGPYLMLNFFYDPFPVGSARIAIDKDRYNEIDTRQFNVTTAMPPWAYQVRYASSAAALATTPFQDLTTDMIWIDSGSDVSPTSVFMQYNTRDGFISPVYSDTALLDLLTVTIVAGTKTATTTDLNLTLVPPPSAKGIKIAYTTTGDFTQSDAGLGSAVALPVKSSMVYTVTAIAGLVDLSFQYVDGDGSPVTRIFHGSITL